MVLGLIGSASAATDYMNITKVQTEGISTRVSFIRGYDDQVLMTGDFIFENRPTMQELVNKVAMRCDNNIAVSTKLASTTIVMGKVSEYAMARYEAFQKKGLTGYLVELARQMDLMR